MLSDGVATVFVVQNCCTVVASGGELVEDCRLMDVAVVVRVGVVVAMVVVVVVVLVAFLCSDSNFVCKPIQYVPETI